MAILMDEVIAKVQRDHELRKLECRKLPKKRKGKRERLRPNTALISYAAEAKMLRRLLLEPRMADVVDETSAPLQKGA